MRYILLFIFFVQGFTAYTQVVPERDRAAIVDQILADRLNTLLPQLMDDTDIDMWILISREYNEDPVLKTMLPATWLNARRRTILVFYRDRAANTIEKLAIARYNVGDAIVSAWDKEKEPDQWKALMDIIQDRAPQKIALNTSDYFGLADGLVHTDRREFMMRLPESYQNKIISAEPLAVRWLETRTALEMQYYEQLVAITHDIIAEAFSTKIIRPGITTTNDVVWFLRQKVTDMGLDTWFHPTIDIQRSNTALESHLTAFSNRPEGQLIQRGDLLHCDFGITYLRLNTDCQQHAYVLKEGETEAPQFLRDALADGNRVQDILTTHFETGKTGNQILLGALSEGKDYRLTPAIYTHPLGLYGHAAGPTIGMWDSQGGVPGTGDYPLFENTVYAIELNTTVHIPQWDKHIRIMLEEAGFWGTSGFRYVNQRQTDLILIN